jgi:glycolate oxidase FAD binding subunit
VGSSVIEEVLPKDQIQRSGENGHLLGNGGTQIMEALSEGDIANVLAFANKHGKTVNIVSGGTKRGYGGQLEEADILLSLAKYSGIVEHSAGDLTLTVRPGTTLAEIDQVLRASGQRIALDASWPETATIGGIIAANDSGAKRLLYGSARDLVIGMRIVYPDGRIIRTGGKVVKNVAGYDMNKLFIGSMGTLGVISEITVKLRPLPKYEALSLVHFSGNNVQAIRDFAVSILDSMMETVSLETLYTETAGKLTGKKQYTLAIAFEDREKAVLYQENWVKEHLPAGAAHTVLAETEAKNWWDQFRKQGINGSHSSAEGAALKVGSSNLDVPGNLKTAEALAEKYELTFTGHGGLGHGISRIYIKGDPENIADYISVLRAEIEQQGGYAVCTHLPFTLREVVSVWGEKPAHFPLLEGIKRTNDPNLILNRGRFVGGI